MLYFVVTATLTSLQLCDGEAFVQRPSSPGSIYFKSVKHESVGPTRHGSLVFRAEEQGKQKSTPVLHNLMDARLKRMDPSVQCSDNLMTLRVKRVGAPYFLVESGWPLYTTTAFMGGTNDNVLPCCVTTNLSYLLQIWDGGAGWPLYTTTAFMGGTNDNVLPCCVTTNLSYLLQIWDGGENWQLSGTWKSLSSVCSSCGLSVEMVSGGLMLAALYNRGPCIETEDGEYILSLLLTDVEHLFTCPSLPEVKPTTIPTIALTDGGPVLQYPKHPQFPMFSQYPVFPGPSPPARTPAPTTSIFAPLPQRPQMPSGAATDSNADNHAAQYPAFSFMPRYPQLPQYPVFPSPVPPTQPTPNKNTAAPLAQLLQMPQSRLYQFPFFPMAPGIFRPATSTDTLVTTPAPTTMHYEKPGVPQQQQFLMPLQYPLLPFPKLPLPPEGQTQSFQDPKPVQQPKPYHVYPQTYQIPVLHPPHTYPSQTQNTQIAAPATTWTTPAATRKPAAQKPFYYPHPYMPAYYVPQQAPMPVFPDRQTTPPAKPAPSDQQEHQPVYRAMHPFYPFPSYQRPKSFSRNQ